MRLDKYLKVSRIIKRRTVANEACDAERVVVNGKTARASYEVKVGDIIEINLGQKPVKLRVTALKETTKRTLRKTLTLYNCCLLLGTVGTRIISFRFLYHFFQNIESVYRPLA